MYNNEILCYELYVLTQHISLIRGISPQIDNYR